jgi:hypothetical protein
MGVPFDRVRGKSWVCKSEGCVHGFSVEDAVQEREMKETKSISAFANGKVGGKEGCSYQALERRARMVLQGLDIRFSGYKAAGFEISRVLPPPIKDCSVPPKSLSDLSEYLSVSITPH